MESSRSDQIRCIAGFSAAGALLAYLGRARLKDVALFGGVGMLGGFSAAELWADPGKGPVEVLTLKVQECFRTTLNALREMGEQVDADLQYYVGWRLDQTLDYAAVLCLSFWVWYSLGSMEFEDSVLWTLGTTTLWGVGRTLLFTDPPPSSPPASSGGDGTSSKPPAKPYVPPPPVPPVPLTPEEEGEFATLLEECRANLDTIRRSRSGISNPNFDCYMNALIQWLRHTNLLDEVVNTDPEKMEVEAKRFYYRFVRTLLQMGQLNGFVNATPNSTWARSSLQFPASTQEDAHDAAGQIGNFFGLGEEAKQHNWWRSKVRRQFDISDESELLVGLPPYDQRGGEWDASPVDDQGYRIDSEPPQWMLQMVPVTGLENEEVDLQAFIDHQFTPLPRDLNLESENVANRDRFTLGEHTYASVILTDQTLLQESRPDLFCMFKRFGEGRAKLKYRITTEDFKVNIDNKFYEVRSFIVHSGPTMSGGHYYTYAKQGETWLRFDDDKPVREHNTPEELEEVAREFEQAYIVHFAHPESVSDAGQEAPVEAAVPEADSVGRQPPDSPVESSTVDDVD